MRSVLRQSKRGFAAVADIYFPPNLRPPDPPPQQSIQTGLSPVLAGSILGAAAKQPKPDFVGIVDQYLKEAGHTLDVTLPYESRPEMDRRPTSKDVFTIAHCVDTSLGTKIALSTAFALNVNLGEESVIISSSQPLNEIRSSPLFRTAVNAAQPSKTVCTGSFALVGTGDSVRAYPISRVLSSLPLSDLVLFSCRLPPDTAKPLPVSPYPPQKDTSVCVHVVSHRKPSEPGWNPWVGGSWSKWIKGSVVGYRGFGGREALPGTYDALTHLLFTPVPTADAIGGPIIEEETGAVVGVILGTRAHSIRLEGRVRGWGVPSEMIYEMFSLPGLQGKK